MGRKFVAIACLVGFMLAFARGAAFGELTKDEQKCINAMNKNLRKVAKAQLKDNARCVKDATKGKESDPESCLSADNKTKVAKSKSKTLADETKKCTAMPPSIGYTSGATVNAAAMAEALALAEDVFGSDLNTAISTEKHPGKCQTAVIRDVGKIVDTKLKEFAKWKKTALKEGAMTAAELAGCLGQDPKGKIGNAISKLGDDIGKKCPGGIATSLFPGNCDGLDGAALRDCLDVLAECRVCLMVTAADGLAGEVDCDLFDDGLDNDSCPPGAGSDLCGNGVIGEGETCDGTEFGGVTCAGATPTCSVDCLAECPVSAKGLPSLCSQTFIDPPKGSPCDTSDAPQKILGKLAIIDDYCITTDCDGVCNLHAQVGGGMYCGGPDKNVCTCSNAEAPAACLPASLTDCSDPNLQTTCEDVCGPLIGNPPFTPDTGAVNSCTASSSECGDGNCFKCQDYLDGSACVTDPSESMVCDGMPAELLAEIDGCIASFGFGGYTSWCECLTDLGYAEVCAVFVYNYSSGCGDAFLACEEQ